MGGFRFEAALRYWTQPVYGDSMAPCLTANTFDVGAVTDEQGNRSEYQSGQGPD
ncbi:hypothetical protein Fraau_0031 [Frateuria aurantia DSM 6220]|uniref:Uncharacterized protein n=1 Tax=Frateuria aurantia (strain ATCC 33424 / DSM 6220 / KCTC 2777 / LMG 1558 / NBRC 3245 / NCIMB 13370) TaxID=767434 RepID=H8KZ51_FRAAD|nr:hypothetical protein Fraau_0031 [Frateuria aurantia DSM 6220]